MLSYWRNSVTIYHKVYITDENGREKPRWTVSRYYDCFTHSSTTSVMVDRTRQTTPDRYARIPGKVPVAVGDVCYFGYERIPISDETVDADILAALPGAFIITEVHDNSEPRTTISHTYVGG